jgi:phage terminase large subunit-like protein
VPATSPLISALLARGKPSEASHWYCDRAECDGRPHDGWPRKHARTSQRPPDGQWLTWLFAGGRGTGKTRAGAEWVLDQVWNHGRRRIALVARTPGAGRDVMIHGPAGLLACSPEARRPVHEPSKRTLRWPNGAQAWTYSAANPSELRGPEHDCAWADETAAWEDASKGDVLDTSWNNLMLGLRLGDDPRCFVTTTPKKVRLVRELIGRPSTRSTTDTTYANLENLAPAFREQVLQTYEGTRIGRQELMGELLTDVDGALWTLERLEELRVDWAQDGAVGVSRADLSRVVVGVDPAVTSGEDADETGIIVVGLGPHRPETCRIERCRGHGYVLADYSVARATPDEWAKRVVEAYDDFDADRVVAEGNQGHELVETVLRTVRQGLPITRVNAKHGKRTRAEPQAALYEQGRCHHVGPPLGFAQFEDQLTTWTTDSGESPDRLDAGVWALTELGLAGGRQGDAFLQMWEKEAAELPERATPELAHLPRQANDGPPTLRAGCKHRWQAWPGGLKCVFCGGDKP